MPPIDVFELKGSSLTERREPSHTAQRVRIVLLVDAALNSGLAPVTLVQLHTFAYLADVLSPVWGVYALDGRVLKRRDGPFYPQLQRQIDRLVGSGVIRIHDVTHIRDQDDRWRLQGSYSLNRTLAEPVLDAARRDPDEQRILIYLEELAFAMSSIDLNDLADFQQEEATYSDPDIDLGEVLDYGEWRRRNFSSKVAGRLLATGSSRRLNKSEAIHLYIRHLSWRLHRDDGIE